MANYIAVIHKEADSDFGVSFPDFPGCITAGKDIDEAKNMAQEALELHVAGMRQDGESLPSPSTLDHLVQSEWAAGAVAFFIISIKAEIHKAVRFNATMDSQLLERVDIRAREMGLTRSGFLTKAAWHELGERR